MKTLIILRIAATVMGKKSKTAPLGAEACLLRPYFGFGFSLRLFRAVQQYVGQFDVSLISLGH